MRRSPGGVAPSNIPLAPGGYTPLGRVEARDCKVNLLGLIPVSGGNHVADAMSKALGKIGGADALVDISIDRVVKFFILWSEVCTEVRDGGQRQLAARRSDSRPEIYRISWPAFTSSVSPVTIRAWSEQKKMQALATSSSLGISPSGMLAVISAITSDSGTPRRAASPLT